MAKATKTEQVTIHPDDLLIQQYQAAQEAITAYQARLNAIKASIQAASSTPSQEAVEAAKTAINAFLEKEYPNKSARRGVAMDIDLDGYKFATTDVGDVSPALFEIASAELEGKILVSSDEALFRSIVDYVCSARDEDGAPVLLQYQQDAVKHLFFPPAAPVQRAARTPKPRTEGEATTTTTSGTESVGVKVCKWPGTDIAAKVSEFQNGTIRVQGRAKSNLIDALAKIGITVSKDAVDKTMAEVYKAS